MIAPLDEGRAGSLARELGCSIELSRCLLNRGIADVEAAALFLKPRLALMKDPFLLPDMGAAVERLELARSRRERVVLFGDYDVDGVTATAILKEAMTALGWQVCCYLPSRFGDGYGLSATGVCNCVDQHQPQVLLAVDCGSTSVESITWLQEAGIDVIVLDHHQLGEVLPPAVALINPRRRGGEGTDFCSAGLAFKLAHALVKAGRRETVSVDYDVRLLLDLAVLGTVADLVPLRGENRILATAGLARLASTLRPGLRALKAMAGTQNPPGVFEVAFQLAPRLNAAGRLDSAADALELLLTRDPIRAAALARKLDGCNRERQRLENEIADEALQHVRDRFDAAADFVIVEGREHWHVGVVGIVASRVLREFHRPTIILGGDGADWRGSGRSIEGFDLGAALGECRDLLVRHGGHGMAAGLTVRPEQVEPLRRRLNALARDRIRPEELHPALRLDFELSLSALDIGLVTELHRLAPIGQGNADVQVMVRDLRLRGAPKWIGGNRQHARFSVENGSGLGEAVWWNCAGRPMPVERFDLAVSPQLNHYQGRTSVQLRVLDWRPVE